MSPPATSPLIWRHRRGGFDLTRQAAIMGILNVTPDSFSDGGVFQSVSAAVDHGLAMAADGADILDVGGESTRPGAAAVSEDEECQRVLPVIEAIRRASTIPISIDTSKATVARAAVNAGADIINDVTGLTGDPQMASVVASTRAGLVIMHMRGTPRTMQRDPQYDDVVADVRDFLRQQFDLAVASRIDPMAIALDPGIGFGKTPQHNCRLLARCADFALAGRPVLIGASRKSFLGRIAGTDSVADRYWPGVALTSLCRELGARIFRVHDVLPHRHATRMTEAILEGFHDV